MVVVPNVGFAMIAVTMLAGGSLANTAPYDQSKYRSVLDDSYLQAPTSVRLVNQGEFAGVYNQYFYVPDEGDRWMTFEVSGKKHRSELRQASAWYLNDTVYVHKMIGHVVVESTEVEEVTFMQIHDVTGNENAINRPLLRLVWMASYRGVSNSYWAIIKADACAECYNYDKIVIAPHSATKIKFEIRVQESKLTVKVNGVAAPEIYNYDVSYWNHLESYFKAGVYNQADGTGKVKFWTLKHYEFPI
eukprot:TRINITY_DN1564_c2_g2_i1.p1 TRINITY_DN1564_c2_g2~~TRINITY_DN1564_c2_g2_i1.p1  ORF type:complete len:246 (+),score=63.36 TRINITY_DN1564_c2_g2_i1:56-793(+)